MYEELSSSYINPHKPSLMKWSKYNHITQNKYGSFVFNSVTNSFIQISDELKTQLQAVQNWDTDLSRLDADVTQMLLEHKIVVPDGFDADVFNQKKYLKYLSSIRPGGLGLTIATTTGCNFRCPYCYEEGVKAEHMGPEVEDAIIKYIESIDKPLDITWYGGEPLMNWGTIERLTHRIAAIEPTRKVTYSLITNGYALTPEKCDFFAQTPLQHIQITLDGVEATHNQSRISKNGQPSFQRIMENIDYALSVLPRTFISIRVNIGQHNREDYPLLRKEIYDRWGKYRANIGIHFAFIVDYKSCQPNCLTTKQRVEYILELYKKHHIISRDIFPKNRSGVCCANHLDSFVIAPNGALYKCWVDIGKKEKQVGTIFEPDKQENFTLLSRYATDDKFSDPQCMDCFLLPLCGGLCPAVKEVTPPEDRCPYDCRYLDEILEILYEIMISARDTESELVKAGKIVPRKTTSS